MKNLDTFYSVKRPIDKYSHIFNNYEEANQQYHDWATKYRDDLQGDGLLQSSISDDGYGGKQLTYSYNTSCKPDKIETHTTGSANSIEWSNCPGFDTIRWGD